MSDRPMPITAGLQLTRGPVATITIANPQRMNAMTAAMWGALPELIAQAEADPAVRVIVLRGEGTKAFCAGADISEFDTARAGEAVHVYDQLNHTAFDTLSRCSKPTIALIRGFCLGGGMGLALACDLRLADETATFAIPAAKLGIGYNPRWIRQLLSVVSPAVAKEILFTGARFSSTDAVSRGLITCMLPADQLEAGVLALATEIAGNAPLSIRASKAMINELADNGGAADLASLDHLIAACFASADYAEGRRAFMAKRKPEFKGA
jgi:enoyl-CoA hydratase